MLSIWLKKLILAAALAVMPLQGVAATLSVLLCHGEAQTHSAHAGGDHNHVAHQDRHLDQHQGDDGAAGSSLFHLCCNYTVTAPSDVTLPVSLPEFPVRAYALDPLHDLYVPDRPQRPPLA